MEEIENNNIITSERAERWPVFCLLAASFALIVALAIVIPKMQNDREALCRNALWVMETEAPEIVLTDHFINISTAEAAKLLPGFKAEYVRSISAGEEDRYEAGMTLVALYLRLGRKADAVRILEELSKSCQDAGAVRKLLDMLGR